MARKRASFSPGPSLARLGVARSLPLCLGRADCLMRAGIVDRPLQPALPHDPVSPGARGAKTGFVLLAADPGRSDDVIAVPGRVESLPDRNTVPRAPRLR